MADKLARPAASAPRLAESAGDGVVLPRSKYEEHLAKHAAQHGVYRPGPAGHEVAYWRGRAEKAEAELVETKRLLAEMTRAHPHQANG